MIIDKEVKDRLKLFWEYTNTDETLDSFLTECDKSNYIISTLYSHPNLMHLKVGVWSNMTAMTTDRETGNCYLNSPYYVVLKRCGHIVQAIFPHVDRDYIEDRSNFCLQSMLLNGSIRFEKEREGMR